MIIRVELPWGALGEQRMGGDMVVNGSYFAPRWEIPLAEDKNGNALSGQGDLTGAIRLSPEDIARWERHPLVVSAEGCRPHVMDHPPKPLPSVLDVRLEPDAPLVHFRGRVVNERGEGLANAAVFGEFHGEATGVRTSAYGAFDLPIGRRMLMLAEGVRDANGDPAADATVKIGAVAPGHLTARVACHALGQDDVQIVLAPDTLHGRLTIDFTQADGSPAAGARAWLYPAGVQFRAAFARDARKLLVRSSVEAERPDVGADTRWLLARLLGGFCVDEQIYLGLQASGAEQDLVADESGRLLLPALLPGRYHLRAVRADRTTSCRGVPYFSTLHVRETLDTEIEVFPPPTATHRTLRLVAGRTVIGRVEVAVNPTWHCGHRGGHNHGLHVEDWAWGRVGIRSGKGEDRGRTVSYSGAFRLDGVPRGACTLRLGTFGHPDVRIDLLDYPANAIGEQDLGTIVVPDARAIQVQLRNPDGTKLDRKKPRLWQATVEGFPGVATTIHLGIPGLVVYAPTPPPAGATIVVAAREGGRVLVRAPIPATLDPTQPIEIRVPNIPPPTEASEGEDDGDVELGAE